MINEETISSLLKIYKDDEKILNTIERCLISFEEYHSQIYKLEICMKIFSNGNVDKDNYKIKIEELDKSRTTYHNALLVMLMCSTDWQRKTLYRLFMTEKCRRIDRIAERLQTVFCSMLRK